MPEKAYDNGRANRYSASMNAAQEDQNTAAPKCARRDAPPAPEMSKELCTTCPDYLTHPHVHGVLPEVGRDPFAVLKPGTPEYERFKAKFPETEAQRTMREFLENPPRGSAGAAISLPRPQRKYTFVEALEAMEALTNEIAELLAVANSDVRDIFGEEAAQDDSLFNTEQGNGTDRPTSYAMQLAGMLVKRMVSDPDFTLEWNRETSS